jgi:hypothetical protein
VLVKGISRADLDAALEIASGTLGNRLELYAMYPANRRRSAWRFRVKVADPDAPGAALLSPPSSRARQGAQTVP